MLISIIQAIFITSFITIFIGVSIHKAFLLCFYLFYTTFAVLRLLFIGVSAVQTVLEENCVNFHSRGKRLRFAVGLRRVEDVHLIMQSDFDFIRHAIDAREQRGNFSFMAG